uniref:Uncharacterized protein n=1 Tax=Ficus carica TaxID=3494 RepID=A0AA88JDP9_FICCA|nr:hypothetical protein TIFTF001_037485 [Ficus carica]GMN68436.1 hypothetical protein TIFTF001_037497 [Ficus carica]
MQLETSVMMIMISKKLSITSMPERNRLELFEESIFCERD